MRRAKSVDDYVSRETRWRSELVALRKILLATGLTEEVKWGGPCYTFQGKNIVGLSSFKSYFGLWFYQGALLKDAKQVLVNAQEGRTKAMRQWRMTNAAEIRPTVVKRYVEEAVANAVAGREIKAERAKPIHVPPELQKAMRRHKGATAAFRGLRPGQQREYADYVTTAKREDTRKRRIERILPMIAAGIGLNDQYRR